MSEPHVERLAELVRCRADGALPPQAIEDIARLMRERDEAISERHEVVAVLDVTERHLRAMTQSRDELLRQRDEARAEVAIRQTGALPPLEHLLRENDRLLALLREVQWNGHQHGGASGVCPCCAGAHDYGGHALDCRLAAALELTDA